MTMTQLRLISVIVALVATPAIAEQASTVIASEISPHGSAIVISADESNVPTATIEMQFALSPLPSGIELTSCALRVVLDRNTSQSDDNGVLLQLFEAGDSARPVAALRVPPRSVAGAAVHLRSSSLCGVLERALKEKNATVRFRLQTTTRNGRLSFAGSRGEEQAALPRHGHVPRLLLRYHGAAEGRVGDADWGQIRHGAGHGGRSDWRLHDPGGGLGPTTWTTAPIPVTEVATDLRQSPILYRGRILTVTGPGEGPFRLVTLDRSGAVVGQTAPQQQPRFLAAGGAGRLAYATENHVLLFDPLALSTPSVALQFPDNETMRDPPTIGRDGALYTVTNQNIRGFTAGLAESWRFRIGNQDDISAVTLSDDETTAYVLIGGAQPALMAIDAGTGDCRWSQPLKAILHGSNEPMPIPVVTGTDILVTDAFPTGDSLNIIHDIPPPAPPSDRGGIVPPTPTATCRAETAPAGLSRITEAEAHVPTPVAGISNDAFYLRSGRLCRGRSGQGDTGRIWDESCIEMDGCPANLAQGITLLIGDSSGGANAGHLYGLAPVSRQIFFITATPEENGGLRARCLAQTFAGLGPNLVLGPDGTLFNTTIDRGMQAIVPAGFEATAGDITLTEELLDQNRGSAFRTPGEIVTSPDLRFGPTADAILVAGKRVVFSTGLRVSQGAYLRARAGF